jgi:GNAT superfamily N-acetyltransferase
MSKSSSRTIRLARSTDVERIRALLADDELGRAREDLSAEGLKKYQHAFRRIDEDPGNELWVVEQDESLIATAQVTWIPYLSRGGNERCLVEAVRVASDLRGRGIGRELMLHIIERARQRGCNLVQLTSDRTRADAHRFYERLGFETSHHGMKLRLQS